MKKISNMMIPILRRKRLALRVFSGASAYLFPLLFLCAITSCESYAATRTSLHRQGARSVVVAKNNLRATFATSSVLKSSVDDIIEAINSDEDREEFPNNGNIEGKNSPKFHHEPPTSNAEKLQSRLLKSLRQSSLAYEMLEPNDRIMVCISGGKDSATLLHLLLHLQSKLAKINSPFELVAVHLNQMQPGYDNKILIEWLDSLNVEYKIVTEDTYSIVKEKTPEGKAYCSLCSRLRRGILYSIAHELKCNKIALGHHGDDAMETLILNMVHGGVMKGMPARYYSATRDMHVIRPLITCIEKDIAEFSREMAFPILPCNLCGSQEDLHRGKAKMLCDAMESMNPQARKNVITAMGNTRPSHLLDENLREACGLDRITGAIVDQDRAALIGEKVVESVNGEGTADDNSSSLEGVEVHRPSSFIESLL